jgi:predicted solute-binding protein
MAKRIGIVPYRYAAPLHQRLNATVSQVFELVQGSSPELAIQLRQHTLGGAFLSPLDYAREYQMYRIVPEAGIWSAGKSGVVHLLFREGARSIGRIAVNPAFTSEIVLAHLVLLEKFDIRPTMVPMTGSVDSMLLQTDAALVAGDNSLDVTGKTNRLDLVDEWTDLSETPFVHGIWAVRQDELSKDEAGLLQSSTQDAADELDENLLSYQYQLSPEAIEGMTEFFRMAYYHGVLKDIPDIHFLNTGESNRPRE